LARDSQKLGASERGGKGRSELKRSASDTDDVLVLSTPCEASMSRQLDTQLADCRSETSTDTGKSDKGEAR